MRIDGIQLVQGSNISNLVVASGTSFPSSPDEGELFFRTDAAVNVKGLYAYIGASWDRIASTDSLSAPLGASFPVSANPGDLFYRDSNDSSEGLYVYNGSSWVAATASAAPSFTVTGDVSGTLDGGTDVLTLATVATAGTNGAAGSSTIVTINAKGLVTSVSTTPIDISASQVSAGTFANARIAEANVTQHQAALSLSAMQLSSGVLADARVAASNVTQHQTALSITETQIPNGTLLARLADNETVSGNWTFNNPVISAEPSSASHLTTKNYVDNALLGLTWKRSVKVATTANITLSGTQTIDGVAVGVTSRVLVKNQTNQAENGVYAVAAGAWTRATDFDNVAPIDEINSAAVFVETGATQSDTGWTQASQVTTIGTDAITFVQFSAAGAYVAGTGMSLTGNTFNVNTASASRIVVNVDDIDLAPVTNSGTGTFQKLTTDGYGRVTGTQAVTTADITGLVSSEYLRLDGSVAMTGGLRISDGSVTNPGLRFADDLTTGIYAPNDFVVAITTQGVERFRVANSGVSTFTGTTGNVVNLTGAAGNTRVVRIQSGGVDRWGFGSNNTAESGSNAGSNFILQRHDDAGAVIDTPLSISRSTGIATLTGSSSLNVLKAGDTMTGALVVNAGVNNAVQITGAAATARRIGYQTAGVLRWAVGITGTAETGTGNAGSDYVINRYDDAGTIIDVPLLITRATGIVTITGSASQNVLRAGDTMTGALGIGEAVGTNELLRVSSATANVPVYARIRATGADTGSQVVGLQLNSNAGLGGMELNGAVNTANAGTEGLNIFAATNGAIAFQTTSARTERMRLTSAGRLGIGMVTPARPLSVGNTTDEVGAGVTAAISTLYLGGSQNATGLATIAYDRSLGAFNISNGPVNGTMTSRLHITSNGEVALGATSTSRNAKLLLNMPSVTLASTTSNLYIRTTDAQAIDKGGSMAFGGYVDNAATSEAPFAYVAGRKENGNTGDFAGYLQIGVTQANAATIEAMRITSLGRVGIGSTAPIRELHVAGVGTADGTGVSQLTVRSTQAYNATPHAGIQFGGLFNSAGTGFGMGGISMFKENATDGDTATSMTFFTRAAGSPGNTLERMRIDSSGNVNIGGTSTTLGKLFVQAAVDRHFYVAQTGTGTTGVFRYDDNSVPSLKLQNLATTAAGHGKAIDFQLGNDGNTATTAGRIASQTEQIWTATASTRDAALTFSTVLDNGLNERMRLTSAGELMVGRTTSSGLGLFQVAISSGNAIADFSNSSGSAAIVRVRATTLDSAYTFYQNSNSGTTSGDGFAVGIDSTLTGFVSNNEAAPIVFNTSGAERMRINSTGDVLFGNAATVTPANDTSAWVGITGGSASVLANPIVVKVPNNAITGWIFESFYRGNVSVGNIQYNGTGTSYVTTSDARRKENIVDAGSAGSAIDAMQVRAFDWVDSGAHTDFGFVAQELATVAPHAVTVGGDDANSEPWGVDYSKLVPMLVKEIQELRARVAALENV